MIFFSLLFISEDFLYAVFNSLDLDLVYKGPLKIDGWSHWLRNYPNRKFAKFISAILRTGAKIGYRGLILLHHNKNHQSARSAPEILTIDLYK